MSDNPQQKPLTITLPEADWATILAALYELPMKFSGPVAARLQTQMAEARKPKPHSDPPHIVAGE